MSSQRSNSNTDSYRGVIITKKNTFSSEESQNRLFDSSGRMKSLYYLKDPKEIGNYKDFIETKTGIYGSEAKIKEFLGDRSRNKF